MLAADELIAASSEGGACDQWAVGAVGLVPRGWRRVGWLAVSAHQAHQGFPVLCLAEGVAGKGQTPQGKQADGAVGLEPAGGPAPEIKGGRSWRCSRDGGLSLQVGKEQGQGERRS